MSRTMRKATAGVVLLACATLITGIVWAKVTRHAVYGEFTYGGTAVERMWTAGEQGIHDGTLHMRGIPYNLNTTTGNIDITIDQGGVCNHVRHLPSGDGHFWGHDYTVQVTWEGKTGIFRGSHSGKAINWAGYSRHVYRGVSGDFVGWKLEYNATWDFPNKTGVFEGVLIQSPDGE